MCSTQRFRTIITDHNRFLPAEILSSMPKCVFQNSSVMCLTDAALNMFKLSKIILFFFSDHGNLVESGIMKAICMPRYVIVL